eukprot:TRINITY_DN768_c0_g1_i1.p1 TRINITY_DN768_c0_g1~~TRINITY_DN768_c0_g1_i1.p1  ORF type:complete len:265 (-),score=26.00 TRINITY_DN768_c0_g1_i1:262-1056(-)
MTSDNMGAPLHLLFLPTDGMLCICRMLDAKSLSAIVCASRFFRYLIECDVELTRSLSRVKSVVGVHILLRGNVSNYIPRMFFDDLVTDLLKKFPALVLQVDLSSRATMSQSNVDLRIYADTLPFKLQDLSPAVRRVESHRLYLYIKQRMGASNAPTELYPATPIQHEPYYFSEDNRRGAEMRLSSERANTFFLRPSSVPDSHVLSYKTRSGVYHALITRWKTALFCGDKLAHYEMSGFFFNHYALFVWYWQKLALSRTWTLLEH